MSTSPPRSETRNRRRQSAAESSPGQDRPAAIAAAGVFRASLVLGALGLASAIFVLARLLESWRVTPHAASHEILIFGQRLSYPAANIDAVVIVLLAALGSVVTARALTGALREIQASSRFQRLLARSEPRSLHDALLIVDPQPRAFCAGLFRPGLHLHRGDREPRRAGRERRSGSRTPPRAPSRPAPPRRRPSACPGALLPARARRPRRASAGPG